MDGEELVQDNLPTVNLTLQARSGVYKGNYDFTEQGEYRVVIYATDTDLSLL